MKMRVHVSIEILLKFIEMLLKFILKTKLTVSQYTVEVWEWVSNFILHITRHVITYPCWD